MSSVCPVASRVPRVWTGIGTGLLELLPYITGWLSSCGLNPRLGRDAQRQFDASLNSLVTVEPLHHLPLRDVGMWSGSLLQERWQSW